MIYPTRRAIVLVLVGAPVALVVGLTAASLWFVALAWLVLLVVMALVDALLAAPASRVQTRLVVPDYLAVGAETVVEVHIDVPSGAGMGASTGSLQAALEVDERAGLARPVVPVPSTEDGSRVARFVLTPSRRGQAVFAEGWVRWKGPLGLVWRQARRTFGDSVPIGADIRRIENEAVRMISRDAQFGTKVQMDLGEGAEFHALRDFQAGMDRRTVDWKQSARHRVLLAKEFRTERNHQIVMALDCGRVMSEPVGGAPRIDRAIHGALLLSYVCLRSGDRAGLFAFDDRPRLSTGALTGVGSFALLHRQAARIDYGVEETNYTLGLTTLSSGLQRRSLIVIFTEFADATAAELMIETVGRIVKKHLVLFVVMRDEELETLVSTAPETPEDVARAVVAATLLRERDLVLARLRRLGAHIVEGPADALGPDLLNAYLDLKRRDLL